MDVQFRIDRRYQLHFCGACLGSLIANGTKVWVDPAEEVKPFDLIAVVLRPLEIGPYAGFINSMGDDGFMGICKIFLGTRTSTTGEKLYLVAQLNPPAISPIPESAIEALHKVIAPVEEAADTDLDEGTRGALELLLPFAVECLQEPVNPAWNPSEAAA
ncbi:MAG: hypothetical protein EOR50_14745 [Mesorhizobium sp.]|nr:hypothetical protein [Mesorhizobium sp.]RWK76251.1 MAG: hypothetical protein EOR50_14745 [Mesorhizobium sp.]RWL08356.1 MAG: hypothetical protein EOR55_04150 [Mesorhizobium sp.]